MERQEPPIYELDVLAPEVALHLALDPEFRLAGRARGGTVDEEEAADPRTSAVAGFLDAARRGDPAAVACTPEDALGTLRVALAAEQAIASGERRAGAATWLSARATWRYESVATRPRDTRAARPTARRCS